MKVSKNILNKKKLFYSTFLETNVNLKNNKFILK